jgi:hypothetical protein
MFESINEFMDLLSLEQISTFLINNRPNAAKSLSGLIVGFILYKTFQMYLKKRKYAHIPGPPTKG